MVRGEMEPVPDGAPTAEIRIDTRLERGSDEEPASGRTRGAIDRRDERSTQVNLLDGVSDRGVRHIVLRRKRAAKSHDARRSVGRLDHADGSVLRQRPWRSNEE